jgi:hypothetical protein
MILLLAKEGGYTEDRHAPGSLAGGRCESTPQEIPGTRHNNDTDSNGLLWAGLTALAITVLFQIAANVPRMPATTKWALGSDFPRTRVPSEPGP